MTDRERLKKIFNEASAALRSDAEDLIFLIRDIEKEVAAEEEPKVAEPTHTYMQGWAAHSGSVAERVNHVAQYGFRCVSVFKDPRSGGFQILFERPVGVTHPDDFRL